jgi:hypothetical protein
LTELTILIALEGIEFKVPDGQRPQFKVPGSMFKV